MRSLSEGAGSIAIPCTGSERARSEVALGRAAESPYSEACLVSTAFSGRDAKELEGIQRSCENRAHRLSRRENRRINGSEAVRHASSGVGFLHSVDEAVLGYLAHARDLSPEDPQIHFLFGAISFPSDTAR